MYTWCGHLEVKSSGLREFLKVIYTPPSTQATQTSHAEFPRSRIQSPVTGAHHSRQVIFILEPSDFIGKFFRWAGIFPTAPTIDPNSTTQGQKPSQVLLPCNIHSRNSFWAQIKDHDLISQAFQLFIPRSVSLSPHRPTTLLEWPTGCFPLPASYLEMKPLL